MSDVTIIGSGVIGLCTAYYLNKEGKSITIIDRKEEGSDLNCSFGNAGMIVPSHFVPLAAPGVISKGLKWMFDSTSPFYIKPRFNKDLMHWLWQFYRHANQEHVSRSAKLLHHLNKTSQELYADINASDIFDFEYEEKGLMMLFNTDKCAEEEIQLAEQARRLGIEAQILTKQEVDQKQGANLSIKGGVLFSGDAHINPNAFMKKMKAYLESEGVSFLFNTEVVDFEMEKERISRLKTNQGNISINQLVLALGAWSPSLTKGLDLKIPVQAGKGYSFNVETPKRTLQIPSIFCEAKVAVTPFKGSIRFAGTMEIEGLSLRKNEKRITTIKNAIPAYYPDFDMENVNTKDAWVGLRPCSPDGLPYVGRARYKNLFIGTGHAMMGMSLGPVTGKLISDQLCQRKLDLNIDQLSPLRFGK